MIRKMLILYLLLVLRDERCTSDYVFDRQTCDVGEYIKLTCSAENFRNLFWIRFISGKDPEVLGRTFSKNRFDPHIQIALEREGFVLRIANPMVSDTGLYYCMEMKRNPKFLKGTDLRVKGKKNFKPFFLIVKAFVLEFFYHFYHQYLYLILLHPFPSDPDHPGEYGISQNSSLSDSKTKRFPAEDVTCCSRSRSYQPDSSFTCTQGNRFENKTNLDGYSAKTITYSFFKNVSSSNTTADDQNVATCEEIFCGDRLKPNSKVSTINLCDPKSAKIIIAVLCTALALSLTVTAFFFHSIRNITQKSRGGCEAPLRNEATAGVDYQSRQDEDPLVYSALVFTRNTSDKVERWDSATEGSIYADVKACRSTNSPNL
ncbi:uncharacterized protein [Antennarius striatus]|uniref:uncharacterized protein isoform X2 n=1 Tax=Antennarius striatus TaxID=241820 RepID=UPI0035B061D5